MLEMHKSAPLQHHHTYGYDS